MPMLLNKADIYHDMNVISGLLDEAVVEIYGQETFQLVQTIRMLIDNGSDKDLEDLFAQLELLSEQDVTVVLRSFGLFLALLTMIQRSHKVVEYEKKEGLTLDIDDLCAAFIPKLHLVFSSYSYETLSIEATMCFQQIFDVIYHYRSQTQDDLNEKALNLIRRIMNGLIKHDLQAENQSIKMNLLSFIEYFKHSIYPGIGRLFSDATIENIPKISQMLVCSTWIGGDYEDRDMSDVYYQEAQTLYASAIKSCYLQHLDDVNDAQEIIPPFIDEQIKEIKEILHKKIIDKKSIEEVKSKTEALLRYLKSNEEYNLFFKRLISFRAQLEVFGHQGIKIEVKFNAQDLVGLMEVIYQKMYQRRLARSFSTDPVALLQLADLFNNKNITQYIDELKVEDQKKWRSLFLTKNAERLILTNVTSLYELVCIRLLISFLGVENLFLTPVFEKVSSIEISSSLIDSYLSLCQQANMSTLLDQIMMAYGECAKESSFWTAQTKIYHAQHRMAQWAKERSLKLEFFQGRGGSISHGGFPTKHLIATSQLTKDHPSLKLTIQGENIRQRFGSSEITAMTVKRYLIEVKNAAQKDHDTDFIEDRVTVREELADASKQEFKYYTQEEQDFFDYFFAVTPVDFILDYQNTSINAYKYDSTHVQPITWSLCWAQNRFFIPIWLGMGSVCHYLEQLDEKSIEKVFNDRLVYSAFMLVLVSLAKTDMRILERYQKELVSPHLRELGEALKIVYKQVQEFSKKFLGFYENDSYFKYFIEDAHYRADYLVPLHLLQIEMLRRYRARKDIEVMKKINFIESILLISIGLQNSG
jgi:phosphoenolpyruvate carboxylase